jgi:alpha-amylase/alpha-mannosidase (GH57 family)
MERNPLSLAILWHMHQPFYKDLVTGEYILPWVRLHAIKDYYDMAVVLKKFPSARVNFNLVPSLLLQLEDYVAGTAKDKFLDLTNKEPKDLLPEERVFILRNFFMANWENMIKPYRRYHDLLIKRGRFVSPAELQAAAKRFSAQDFMDLQVWFNLAWFGFAYKQEDPVIIELIRKGKNYSAIDKNNLIKKQLEAMGRVIPLYKELQDSGQIEISLSPFYHPILPLLCDTTCAKESVPHVKLPDVPFRHPEDAEAQIKMAIEYYRKLFGREPRGIWPSEGSVSEQALSIVAKTGLKWLATDEGILAHSLGRGLTAEDLYQPYDMHSVAMVFRNHFISDQVGFVYYRWKTGEAINDFMHHISNIRKSLPEDGKNYLLTVILDGENAWEFYHDQGKEFLESFYARLSSEPCVRMVQIGDYVRDNPPSRQLSRLFAGSWIDSNFHIWIGHEEDNTAWKYLNEARLVLQGVEDPLAWQELYVAEGSDWCWWYGDDHSSDNDAEFDFLFRRHVKNIYTLIGRNPPAYLDMPIKRCGAMRPIKEPVYLISPVMDGKITNYYEWLSAGHFDIAKARGAMHQIETILSDIYYGFDLRNLFLRMDFSFDIDPAEMRTLSFSVALVSPARHRADIFYVPQERRYACRLDKDGGGGVGKEIQGFGIGRIIEIGIPFNDLGVKAGDKIEFRVMVSKEGQELERWPKDGAIDLTVPSENYALEQWIV